MSQAQPIFIALFGATGGVSKSFLPQLSHLRDRLSKRTPPIDIRLILARNSKKQVLTERYNPLDINTVVKDLNDSKKPYLDFDEIVDFLAAAPGKVVLIDNTADLGLGKNYPKALRKGISIVTANKKGFSDNIKLWDDIFSSAEKGNAHVFHESSCGA